MSKALSKVIRMISQLSEEDQSVRNQRQERSQQNLSLLWHLVSRPLSPRSSCPPHLARGPLTEFGTGTGVIIALLAVSPWGTLEIPALDGPSHAVTGHRTVTGDPRPACLQTSWKENGNEKEAGAKDAASLFQSM